MQNVEILAMLRERVLPGTEGVRAPSTFPVSEIWLKNNLSQSKVSPQLVSHHRSLTQKLGKKISPLNSSMCLLVHTGLPGVGLKLF